MSDTPTEAWEPPEVETPWSDPNHDIAADLRDFAQKSHDSWPLPQEVFDLDPWLEVLAESSNPAFRLFAAEYRNRVVDSPDSAPETGSGS